MSAEKSPSDEARTRDTKPDRAPRTGLGTTTKPVALVVGASSGFGRLAAVGLLEKGFRVFAAARRTEAMHDLEALGADVLYIDVCKQESVDAAVASIMDAAGNIDVLLNNAGYGEYGCIEAVPVESVIRQFDVNVFGMARVQNSVLPVMRDQGYGRIIITASLASNMTTPLTGWYSATKHALAAMCDSLRMEVSALGIDVIRIEPGPVQTGFESVVMEQLDKIQYPKDYTNIHHAFLRFIRNKYRNSPGPKSTAQAMIRAATARRPKAVYRSTFLAKLLPPVKNLLPLRLWDKLSLDQLYNAKEAQHEH